jgi:hypothetical protein
MRKQYLAGWLIVAAAATFASLGCSKGNSGGDPNGRPVTGTVTYKGSPVEGATVTFVSPNNSAFGMTDAQGKFKLKTANGENVSLGDYQVTVVKKEAPPAAAPSTPEEYVPPDPNAPPPPAPKDLLPAKYGDTKSSGLTATVKADDANDFPLQLAD